MTDGTVTHICIAPEHGRPIHRVGSVEAVVGKGLVGDRHFGTTRQVTLVATGELAKAAAELGLDGIPSGATRRNITVAVPDLPRTHGAVISIGAVELNVWRDCPPCEQMEAEVGPGAREALKSRAGVSASVVRGGVIEVGDAVTITA